MCSIYVAVAALWTCPSSFCVVGTALCFLFGVNRNVRVLSSGDNVQIAWQVCDVVRGPCCLAAPFGADPLCVEGRFARAAGGGHSIWDTLHFTLLPPIYFALHTAHFPLYTWHVFDTLHSRRSTFNLDTSFALLLTLHFALYTRHATLKTSHRKICSLKTSRFTVHNLTLHTLHFITFTSHLTLYTSHFTVYMSHFTLCTQHLTLHPIQFYIPNAPHCTLHSALHTLNLALHTLRCTLQTLQCTLHTAHSTHWTLHPAVYTLQSTLYPALYTLHSALHTLLLTLYAALFTLHFALHTLNMALDTLYSFFTLSSPLSSPDILQFQ